VAATPAEQEDRRRGTRDRRLLAHLADDNLLGVEATKQLYICGSCGFIYDPDEGDPDGGIPPGTAFDEIPDTWFCPVCGARKADFEPYDG
jgi:rubredoxin